jgi:hypothetical protein
MPGPERIEWRRSFPSRPLSALLWYAVSATLATGIVWLLFGTEPKRLGSGEPNPLASLPTWAAWLAVAGGLVFVHNVLRRPKVAASHYALTVRPGSRRTLTLPWSTLAEVALVQVEEERFLMVRCRPAYDTLGHRPSWCDQGIMRSLTRAGTRAHIRFDLAVRMNDFVGDPDGRIAALAAFAPDHVTVAVEPVEPAKEDKR